MRTFPKNKRISINADPIYYVVRAKLMSVGFLLHKEKCLIFEKNLNIVVAINYYELLKPDSKNKNIRMYFSNHHFRLRKLNFSLKKTLFVNITALYL